MNILMMTSPAPKMSGFSTKEKRPPLGVATLIAIVEQRGHKVVFDDQYLSPWPIFDTAQFLTKHKIDVVGIYSNTICLQGTLSLVRKLQYLRERKLWNGRIGIGGPHTSFGADSLPEYVDHICIGEGDITFYEFIEGIEKQRIVVGKKVEDLNTLPMPAWNHLIYRNYNWSSDWDTGYPLFTLNTSRGCPFSCTFCSVKGVWGQKYRYMDAEKIIQQLEIMRKYYGIQAAYFREDHFTLNQKRTVEFCESLLKKNFNINWLCETRADSIEQPGVLELMAASGCKAVYIGVESGSQRMLDKLKKHETVSQFEFVIAKAKKLGIKTYASMIYGVPGETQEDIRLTEEFLERTKPDFVGKNAFVGLPGSEIYAELRATGQYDYEDENGLLYPCGYEQRSQMLYGEAAPNIISKSLGCANPATPNEVTKPIAAPLVSVIIPAYNAAPFIHEAIQSILDQTFQDFEIIVVDDASTDDTVDAIRSIRDPRLYLHRNPSNIGITATLNKLLHLARGKYIARMDADDISLPHRLMLQVNMMEQNPDLWACGGHFFQFYQTENLQQLPTGHDAIKAALLFFCPLPHPFVMIRKSAFLENDITYNESMYYAQDYELWHRIACNFTEARFANVPGPVGRYRQLPTSISLEKKEQQDNYAKQARMQTFEHLGINPSHELIPYHQYLYSQRPPQLLDGLIKIFEWAKLLKTANEQSNMFCQELFNNYLLNALITICNRCPQFARVSQKLLPIFGESLLKKELPVDSNRPISDVFNTFSEEEQVHSRAVAKICSILPSHFGRQPDPERGLPGETVYQESNWYKMMLARYFWAGKKYCTKKNVLDLCSGFGWGASILSLYANKVTCIEIDDDLVQKCKTIWGEKSIDWQQGNALHLSQIAAESVDIVTAMEAIEHFSQADGQKLLAQAYRVLQKGGYFIASSYFAENAAQAQQICSTNEFHLHIYTKENLVKDMEKMFDNICFLGNEIVIARKK